MQSNVNNQMKFNGIDSIEEKQVILHQKHIDKEETGTIWIAQPKRNYMQMVKIVDRWSHQTKTIQINIKIWTKQTLDLGCISIQGTSMLFCKQSLFRMSSSTLQILL